MPLKNISVFWKILITLFAGGVIFLICGRSHFIFGTFLITFRWILFAFGVGVFYLTLKRVTPKLFKISLLLSILIIPSEYVWNKIKEKNLENGNISTEISLMTYNVFFKNSSPKASLTIINNYNPDILLIQELTPNWKVQLQNSIGQKYPYKRITALRGTHGIGVYSKFPIIHSKLLGNKDQPYAQILELNVNGKTLQLINVHLASPAIAVEHPEDFIALFSSNYESRCQQIESINTIANQAESDFNAQILIGDLNTTRYEPIYREIRSHWVNLYDLTGNGWGFNFPNSKKLSPIVTLDYIFGRGVIKSVDMKVIGGGSSDHLAVAGKIKI